MHYSTWKISVAPTQNLIISLKTLSPWIRLLQKTDLALCCRFMCFSHTLKFKKLVSQDDSPPRIDKGSTHYEENNHKRFKV